MDIKETACISYFSRFSRPNIWQKHLKERFGLAHGLGGYSPSWWGRLGFGSVRQPATLLLQTSTERQWFSLCSVSARGMVLPPFSVGPPSSVKHFWKPPHNDIKMCVSMAILHPTQMMVKTDHRTVSGRRRTSRHGGVLYLDRASILSSKHC